MNRIRVVIADDHLLFRQGLKRLLEVDLEMDIEVVAAASSGRELIGILKTARPHIVLLDLNMPGMDGLDAFKKIKDWNGGLKVIVLTMYDDAKIVKTVLKSGVDGYILKQFGLEEVLNAIKEVLAGNVYIGKSIELNKGKVLTSKNQHKFDDKFIRKYRLTKRELEILQLIGQALNNKEIAKELYISDQTVSVHRKNIMRKLNVSNTAGLIMVAYSQSLIHYE